MSASSKWQQEPRKSYIDPQKKMWHIRKDMWIEVIEYVIRIMDRYVQNYASEKRDKLIQGGKTTFSRKEI